MSDPLFTIPAERLPPGFADTLDQPVTNVAEPKPAATVVMLRDAADTIEVLLLKRHRASGFVPGAYVFPGGRTDEADDAPALLENCPIPDGAVPAHFWFGAVREVFEETGILLARTKENEWAADATSSETMEEWRLRLMQGEATLLDVINGENLRIDLEGVAYFAHWITPVAEPRRYDTRFFIAAVPDGRVARPDAREMDDAIWISPAQALANFREGRLPMVFPTVHTLQDLEVFESVHEAVETLRKREVTPIMPTLVRTPDGVGIVIDS